LVINIPNTNITISLWAKAVGSCPSGDDNHLFGSMTNDAHPDPYRRLYVRCRENNWAFRLSENAGVNTGIPVVLDQWYYVVLVMNGTDGVFYLDGTEIISNSYTPYTLVSNISIGNIDDQLRTSWVEGWNGTIDELLLGVGFV